MIRGAIRGSVPIDEIRPPGASLLNEDGLLVFPKSDWIYDHPGEPIPFSAQKWTITRQLENLTRETYELLTGLLAPWPDPEGAILHAQGQLSWPPTAPDDRHELVRVRYPMREMARQLRKQFEPMFEGFREQMLERFTASSPESDPFQKMRERWLRDNPEEN